MLISPNIQTPLAAEQCVLTALQIQRNLASDGSIEEMRKVAVVPESKAKVGASLGYNVRTLLTDLGMEVGTPPPRVALPLLHADGLCCD